MLLQGGELIEVGAGGGGGLEAGVALGRPRTPGRLDHVPNNTRCGCKLIFIRAPLGLSSSGGGGPIHRVRGLHNKLH